MTMSESKIRRKSKVLACTLFTATADCSTLPMFDMAGGVLEMGTIVTAATSINIWASDNTNGPFCQLYDASGSAASITLAPSTNDPRAYALPDATFAAHFVKFVAANTAGTGTVATIMFKG
jgi:hypothetical protein